MATKTDLGNIVEIGPSSNPAFNLFSNKTFDNIGNGVTYTAVDCDPKALEEFKHYYGDKGEILEGSLKKIPLPENSADQVWLMNVFGGFQNPPQRLPDGTLQYTLGLGGTFEELTRITRIRGEIYIGEIYPPIGNVSWLADKDFSAYVLEKIAYRGLDEVKSFTQKKEDALT
jgi:hypothetical protein